MPFVRTVGDALSLAVLRRPRAPWHRIGPGQFWLAVLLLTIALLAESYTSASAPRVFDPNGGSAVATYALATLFAAWLAARMLGRPALFWPLAVHALLLLLSTGAGVVLIDAHLLPRLAPARDPLEWTPWLLWAAWLLLALRRLLDHVEPQRDWAQRAAVALTLTGALLLAPSTIDAPRFFRGAHGDGPPPAVPPDEDPAPIDAANTPAFEPEVLLAAQPARVEAALAAVAPGRAGVVDLYLVAFGADGGEDVFRNEVEYVEQLFAQRFGAAGRTLVLLNHPATLDRFPLATLDNLRRALRGIGARMDRDEDVLLLFATTHGSESHELHVALDPLPLTQIGPAALRAALDGAGVRHRVAIVSACYAGGFVPALTAPGTLVIAAADADQPSFGCGVDAEITYFGEAFFAKALNRTGSLVEAFDMARVEIAAREAREGYEQSRPQIARDAAVEALLARRLIETPLGAPLEFRPVATR